MDKVCVNYKSLDDSINELMAIAANKKAGRLITGAEKVFSITDSKTKDMLLGTLEMYAEINDLLTTLAKKSSEMLKIARDIYKTMDEEAV